MIPILFDSTETAFTTQGLGRLLDARKCLVTEERNGEYELVLEYPTHGALFSQLAVGNYIGATHDEAGDMQAFKIYRTSAPLDGWVTVNAWHISYALNSIVVEPFTASTCATALSGIGTNAMTTCPFTFTTNKTTSASFGFAEPRSARAILGGVKGSILDVFGGGEYEFNMFGVKLWSARGSNSGVTIRYGKNLTKLDYVLDGSNVYNSVVPFWQNNTQTVYVDHVVTRTGETADGVVPLDLSREWNEPPTTAQLEAKAQSYIDGSTNYVVKDNIKVDFVQLWQTEEYKNYASLEKVKLCDTVNIYYERFGINATAKVSKVVYNTLLDRYASIELGEPQTSLAQQIKADIVPEVLDEVPPVVERTNITADNITAGTLTGVTIQGSTLLSTSPNGSVEIANGNVNFYANADGSGVPFAVIRHVYDSGLGVDALQIENSGYTKLINQAGGQWTADFVQFALNPASPTQMLQIYPDSVGYHAKFLTDDVLINNDLSVSGNINGKLNGAYFQTTLINSGSSKTFTVPSGSRHKVIVAGTVAARMAEFIVGCATNGTVVASAISQGSSITSSVTTNSLTIGTSGGSASVLIITFSGNPITFS